MCQVQLAGAAAPRSARAPNDLFSPYLRVVSLRKLRDDCEHYLVISFKSGSYLATLFCKFAGGRIPHIHLVFATAQSHHGYILDKDCGTIPRPATVVVGNCFLRRRRNVGVGKCESAAVRASKLTPVGESKAMQKPCCVVSRLRGKAKRLAGQGKQEARQ